MYFSTRQGLEYSVCLRKLNDCFISGQKLDVESCSRVLMKKQSAFPICMSCHFPGEDAWLKTTCAGQAAARIGNNWFIAGGGDNKAGCTDGLRLRVTEPGPDDKESTPLIETQNGASHPHLEWTTVSQSESSAAIVSEGMGMVGLESLNLLLTFGGYNGRYLNSIHVYQTGGLGDKTPLMVCIHIFRYCVCTVKQMSSKTHHDHAEVRGREMLSSMYHVKPMK